LYKDNEYNYNLNVFDDQKKLIKTSIYNQSEIIPKGCECIVILECGGIWCVNEKYGMTWRIAQMKVFKTDLRLTGYSFLEDNDNNETEPKENNNNVLSKINGNSQEEEEYEYSEEEVTNQNNKENYVEDNELDELDVIATEVKNVVVSENIKQSKSASKRGKK